MHGNGAEIEARLTTSRARITNGSKLLAGVDGRSSGARRFRDLVHDLSADLGGVAALTTAELATVRNCAGLLLRAEQLQADIARAQPVDANQISRLSNTARRLLNTIADKRRERRAVPQGASPLAAILRKRERQRKREAREAAAK
jgi:hypothetical protein